MQQLADLAPRTIGCGHGPVITGPAAAVGLRALADNYPVPAQGRYVTEPARTDASGVEHLPPAPADTLPVKAALIGADILAAGAAWLLTGGRRRGKTRTVYPPRGNHENPAYHSPDAILPVRRGVSD